MYGEWQQHIDAFDAQHAQQMVAHLRGEHGWTIFEVEEDDLCTLRAMHRCAHQDQRVTPPAQLLPAAPGFPETPVTVISEIAGTHDPIRYQIRFDGSGAYAAVPAYRLRFGGA